VRVVVYERSTTDHIWRIRQVVEALAPRWTFEAGIREAAREALAILRHEADEQMAHSQYRHYPSRAEEGAGVVILPAGGHDHMGCFTNQVKLTRAFVQNLDEAVKEVKLLDEDEGGEEEETDNGGDVATPPVAAPLPPVPPAIVTEEIHEEGPMEAILEQEDLKLHEVTTTEVQSETPQHHLNHALMRDYEEDLLMLEDDFDDLDGYLDGDRSNVEE
jgi:hypothetical protein